MSKRDLIMEFISDVMCTLMVVAILILTGFMTYASNALAGLIVMLVSSLLLIFTAYNYYKRLERELSKAKPTTKK